MLQFDKELVAKGIPELEEEFTSILCASCPKILPETSLSTSRETDEIGGMFSNEIEGKYSMVLQMGPGNNMTEITVTRGGCGKENQNGRVRKERFNPDNRFDPGPATGTIESYDSVEACPVGESYGLHAHGLHALDKSLHREGAIEKGISTAHMQMAEHDGCS
jgi:hypothetical protein